MINIQLEYCKQKSSCNACLVLYHVHWWLDPVHHLFTSIPILSFFSSNGLLVPYVTEFSHPSHCERHFTTSHSGFGLKCSSCGLIPSKTDQKHTYTTTRFIQLLAPNCIKSNGHFTGEKALEFETFHKNRSMFSSQSKGQCDSTWETQIWRLPKECSLR